MRICLLAWGIGLFLTMAAHAGSAGSERTEALLRSIGMEAYMASFADEVGGTDNAMARSFTDIADAWNAAAKQSFDPDEMFLEMVDVMAGRISAQNMDALEAFYRGPLGRKVTAMEIAAQRPDASLTVKTEGTHVLRRLIEREDPRLGQLTDLIDALSAVETGLAMAVNLNHAVLSGMAASGQLPYAMSDAQITAMVDAQRGMMRGAIQEQLFISLAYTYQTLSDEDLADYISFLRSPQGRELYSEMLAATEMVIGVRAAAFGRRLMDLQATKSL